MVNESHFERDPAKYDDMVRKFIKIAFDDVASIPLYQPYSYVAMQKRISGYRYWFHRQMDYRTLVTAATSPDFERHGGGSRRHRLWTGAWLVA